MHQLCREPSRLYLINLSKAMRGIDNPLVMINLRKFHESIHNYKDLIILPEKSLVFKESVIRAVFQEKMCMLAIQGILLNLVRPKKLLINASQFLMAIRVRSADRRRRLFVEIVHSFNA